MVKPNIKLEHEATAIDFSDRKEERSTFEFDIAKGKITDLKNDASETADCLDSINSRIAEHKLKMAKLKNLGSFEF